METVIGVKRNEEANVEYGVTAETGSHPTSPKNISEPDPVVYKLVRVDGDGRLVPATDDEVIVVEDLLKDDKCEVHFATDRGKPTECNSAEGCPLEKTHYKCSEGQSGNLEVDAENSNIQLGLAVDLGKTNTQEEESDNLLVPQSDGNNTSQSRNVEGCSSSLGGSINHSCSTSVVATRVEPDFSKVKGEICLDNLTVKELQETFRATFGRETSVKDKQWLKRRISMGLTNSGDFSINTFIIDDNKVIKMSKEETRKSTIASKNLVVGTSNQSSGALSDGCDKQTGNHLDMDAKRPQSSVVEYNSVSDDPNMEQRVAKRVRKPTKRYIEELSKVESRESSGRVVSSVKSSEYRQPYPKPRVRPVQNVRPDGRPIVTRQDSLGGSGVQVPHVSRIRRGRPRENFMALMKLQPSNISMTAKMVKKAFGEPGPRPDDERGNKVLTARLSSGWIQQPLIAASVKCNHYLERTVELEKDVELKRMESFEDNSDDNMVSMSTSTGGMRRKHHRPWSLTEVVKLVEGVARYGAGRWSEIKRLAFASYSYRTSVDLKDKWRNLLRASLAQLPAETGMQNSRKHASVPIPAPILLRVRELAQMQAQVPPDLSSSKFGGHSGGSGKSVHEARSGYL